MNEKCSILRQLEAVAPLFSILIYWENIDSVIIGGNQALFDEVGGGDSSMIGKTPFDIYPYKMAKHIVDHNNEVMRTGQMLSQEEAIEDITTGELKYFVANKAPLRDDDGNIIGLVGTSIDITEQKKAEQMARENEMHQKLIKQQEEFLKDAEQLAHDIRSPLSSLTMILESCPVIPEAERIGLREAANGASNISDSFLGRHKKKLQTAKGEEISVESESIESNLLSATLLQLIADKGYEYKKYDIKLSCDVDDGSYFAFIDIGPVSFRRMLSNLMNNARDAFLNSGVENAEIVLELKADREWVRVVVRDNARGMSQELIKKIKGGVAVTQGKKDGHGIGLTQVRETLERYHGDLDIISTIGEGTSMVAKFPRARPPQWVGDSIDLGIEDTIIVLDDDNSIHGAWDSRFASLLKQYPSLRVKHFHQGNEALDFIAACSAAQKARTFLLSDYELLGQDDFGLAVIEKSGLKRHLLVTSHYANAKLRADALALGVRILPKQLAFRVHLNIDENYSYEPVKRKYDAEILLVDDEEAFCEALCNSLFDEKKVDTYHDPKEFLEHAEHYPKDIPIILDYQYEKARTNGIKVAKKLHAVGYKRLYLLSGHYFDEGDLPDYLTHIFKDDFSIVKDAFRSAGLLNE